MKNIRFYEAAKYNTLDYEKVEDMIYKTYEKETGEGHICLEQVVDNDELVDKLMKSDEWVQGEGDFFENYLIIIYEGKRYYRDIDCIGGEDDIVFINSADKDEKKVIYVTSIMFEQEPELGENEPTDKMISQYPLEDIAVEYILFCTDFYEEENASDLVNSYVEFSSEYIENIRKVLNILGKHVYNIEDGDYIKLKIE